MQQQHALEKRAGPDGSGADGGLGYIIRKHNGGGCRSVKRSQIWRIAPFVAGGGPSTLPAMRAFSKRESREFYRRLAETRPIPQTELEFINPFTLLVAVVLSAQATDAGVNKATPALFALADTPREDAGPRRGADRRADPHDRPLSHQGEEPDRAEPDPRRAAWRRGAARPRRVGGAARVGRKTANVVLNVAFGEPTIAVDTHIFRVANRTGLAPGKTPLAVETALEAITPAEYKRYAHHWLILHGRYVCQARKPDCPKCVVADLCRYGAKTGPAELIAARAGKGEPEALSEPGGGEVCVGSRRRAQREARSPRPA